MFSESCICAVTVAARVEKTVQDKMKKGVFHILVSIVKDRVISQVGRDPRRCLVQPPFQSRVAISSETE